MTPEARFTKIENLLETMAEHQARSDQDIRELRGLHRGMTLAVTKVAEGNIELREAQKITEQKLNALIDTVDRIIGKQGSQPS